MAASREAGLRCKGSSDPVEMPISGLELIQGVTDDQSLRVGFAASPKGAVREHVLVHDGDLIAVVVVVPYCLSYSTWGLFRLGGCGVIPGTPDLGPELTRDSALPVLAVVEHLA